ncbi:hypothetical protein FB451DRAFT_1176117 [Mycena latifolia]|nr:hypothetical protein FB451DRAFT_1176117 [Mycena latifolia]
MAFQSLRITRNLVNATLDALERTATYLEENETVFSRQRERPLARERETPSSWGHGRFREAEENGIASISVEGCWASSLDMVMRRSARRKPVGRDKAARYPPGLFDTKALHTAQNLPDPLLQTGESDASDESEWWRIRGRESHPSPCPSRGRNTGGSTVRDRRLRLSGFGTRIAGRELVTPTNARRSPIWYKAAHETIGGFGRGRWVITVVAERAWNELALDAEKAKRTVVPGGMRVALSEYRTGEARRLMREDDAVRSLEFGKSVRNICGANETIGRLKVVGDRASVGSPQ